MRTRFPFPAAILASLLLFTSAPAMAQSAMDVQRVVREAAPSVVTLLAYDESGEILGQGSGFILTDGRVVTNLHVVYGAAWVEIQNKDGQLMGTVAQADALSARADIVVLPAIADPPAGLRLAPSEPEQGTRVAVIGSPRGLENTVSDGIVSGRRVIEGEDVLQITAPISSGSSGGPVLDAAGQVVGVAVGLYTDGQNLNFAVPVRNVRALVGSPPAGLPFPKRNASARGDSPTSGSGTTTASSGFDQADFEELVPGQVHSGSLQQGEPTFTDGSFFDTWYFRGEAGDRVRVSLSSAQFDAFVKLTLLDLDALENGDIEVIQDWTDDDSGTNTNAVLDVVLPSSAPYLVLATSFEGGETGSYNIRLDVNPSTSETSGSTRDTRWVYASRTSGMTIYFDRQTMSRRGSIAVAWIRWEWAEPTEMNGRMLDSALMLTEFDCDRNRDRVVQSVMYLGLERVGDEKSPNASWKTLVPDSVGEITLTEVCAATRGSR